jgi:WD40 repeat protein
LFAKFNHNQLGSNYLAKLKEAKSSVPIKCISWHPFTSCFALAHSQDIVFIYNLSISSWMNHPLLHVKQTDIYCLAWRPNGATVLAVGSKNGICLWKISMDYPTLSSESKEEAHANCWMTLLEYPNHTNVSSLQWSPCGRYLASGSLLDSSLVIWDVSTQTPTPLKRVGGGITCLSWSPKGDRLVVGHL